MVALEGNWGGLQPLVELGFGYGAEFCWLRVKYLETISSSRPSNNREISRKAVLLFLSRFKKSGIEYVILAGSSLLTYVVGGSIPIWVGFGVFLAARSAQFFNDLDCFAPEIAKFAHPQGHLYRF